MAKRILTVSMTTFSLIVFFMGGYWLGQSPQAPIQLYGFSKIPFGVTEDFRAFWEVWEFIHEEYYRQPVDDTALVEGAIEGLFTTLDDPYSFYQDPESTQAFNERQSGEFEGIGAYIEEIDGDIIVVSPIDGSPAEQAGLQSGDILRVADEVDLTGLSAGEAAAHVRGPAGTTVHLTVERNGELLEFDITRDSILLRTVISEMLEEQIAYVRITQFGSKTPEELEEALIELNAGNPIALILDLRRNPGGSLSVVVNVANQFLEDGIVLIEEFKSGEETIYQSDGEGLVEQIPMVILIDEGSASASEVLAGAIQDRERAVLIGENSFGKGTVQQVRPMSNGGSMRLTVARWLTPNENWVHNIGLKPDINVVFEEEPNTTFNTDQQIQAAINFLLGRSEK